MGLDQTTDCGDSGGDAAWSLSRRFDLHTLATQPLDSLPQAPPEKARPHKPEYSFATAETPWNKYVNSVCFIARNRRGLACAEHPSLFNLTQRTPAQANRPLARRC